MRLYSFKIDHMKIIRLFLLLIGINSLVYAQPFGEAAKSYRIIKSVYENSSGEKGSTSFRYDHESKLIKSFWSLNDKSRYSTNYYEHDGKGNIVSAFREFSDGLLTKGYLKNYDTWLTGTIVYEINAFGLFLVASLKAKMDLTRILGSITMKNDY